MGKPGKPGFHTYKAKKKDFDTHFIHFILFFMKKLLMAAFAAALITSCSKDGTEGGPIHESGNYDVAYLSLSVKAPEAPSPVRASTEDPATAPESAVKTLYAITFDVNGQVVAYKTEPIAKELTVSDNAGAGTTHAPDAFKVSQAAKYLLIVANPGPKFKAEIGNMVQGTSFSALNAAVKVATIDEINDQGNTYAGGFTMINAGDDRNMDDEIVGLEALIDISGNIEAVGDGAHATEAEAKSAAEGNRATIKIERLSSKLYVAEDGNIEVLPAGATFTFDRWVLDAVNTTFYPWAEKVLSITSHASGFYTKNFYTIDPNFDDFAGLAYNTVNPVTFAPEIHASNPTTWAVSGAGNIAYAIENTMDGSKQTVGGATRVVIRGTYYPDTYADGTDWFNFAGTNYETLAILQTAYADPKNVNLITACDNMFAKIKAYAQANTIVLTGTNFATLTQTDLNNIPNGGEIVKENPNCIRWFQKGLCYYNYSIRHNNDPAAGVQEFGKYGVVRNNYYALTLNKVNGPGTPWYPDINNPGPGDPDPKDPIDKSAGYLGVNVEIGPWVKWTTDFEI